MWESGNNSVSSMGDVWCGVVCSRATVGLSGFHCKVAAMLLNTDPRTLQCYTSKPSDLDLESLVALSWFVRSLSLPLYISDCICWYCQVGGCGSSDVEVLLTSSPSEPIPLPRGPCGLLAERWSTEVLCESFPGLAHGLGQSCESPHFPLMSSSDLDTRQESESIPVFYSRGSPVFGYTVEWRSCRYTCLVIGRWEFFPA